ncbi:MAG: chitobiase/beta-hexosaminidase C-terminal domain-containing protein, partial [Bacteroidales bacterium]|nr:chitobiase/beta-hexosaminidase C-terminal domain-containing protein [Bacteroidales bacterium]
PITQGESTLNIYKMPVVTGLMEGDIMTVIGVIGCHNAPQLRVNSADDVTFTHPAGITVNPTALSGFNYVYEEGPSTVKTFNISAISLGAPTYIYASENYEISSFPGESFYPESLITINTYTGVYNYTIKVRLKAGLEIGEYNEYITICEEELDTMYIALSGNVTSTPPQPQGDYTRVSDLSQLTSGSKVIFAARFDENADQYYAMTAQASGKPEGVLFTSIPDNNGETLPTEITDAEDTFYWTVEVDGANYTFTNANGDVLGYNSSTNFATGGDNTAWTITFETSEATAMVPEYSAFVINNVNTPVRAFALNSNHNYGAYHTQNMAADNYNFFIDMFATMGSGTLTCATPTFTPEAGTYYEAQTVTIACATADATIYYTLDGTEPDENSAVYSEPIAVAESMTIKAIAMKEGYENSNVATAEYTIILGAVTIFEQDWEGDMNGWTFVTVEGGKPWAIGQNSGNHYAYANGYNGGVNEQWCISPAFSLDIYSNVSLNFRNAKNYTGSDMELFFSNDYDGSDPTAASWVELEFVKSTGSYAWTESGNIDLANFTGDECYIGFKYTSTETEAAAWEIDDVTLMGFTTDPYLTVTPNALSGFTYIVGNGPSQVQTFTVSGGNLPPAPGGTTGGIHITCSNTHYEFSLDGEEFWPYTISIQATGTLEPTTVYVRLEAGLYVGQWDGVVTFEDGGLEVTATVSGTVIEEPVPGGDWNRIYALSDLHDGDQVIIAARYDATVSDGYYAMTAGVSGKPDGVLFTSVNDGSNEILPAEISDDADTYLWNVTVDGDVITLTNAAGDMLGYSSSTNFAANTSTDWYIALETS